jgi:PAS domain-containing protein
MQGGTGGMTRAMLGLQEPIEVTAFRSAPVGIVLCEAEGVIVATNFMAQQMLESPYPLTGESVHQFIDNPDHPEWVRNFISNPSRASRKLLDGRVVVGKTMSGNPLKVHIYLGHTMYESVRLAIAILCPACECNGS